MPDQQLKSIPDDINPLPQLCREVETRLHDALRKDKRLDPFTEGTGKLLIYQVVIAGCDVVLVLAWIAAAILFLFTQLGCIIMIALGAIALIVRIYVRFALVPARRRRMRSGRVRPAVLIQAYDGGFLPPAEDPEASGFGGIVVYTLDERMSMDAMLKLAKCAFAAKSGPDHGDLADLKKMLIKGDHEYAREAFRFPESLAGNHQTYAAQVIWERDQDLYEGYLSTDLLLVYGNPEFVDEVFPVPLEYWESPHNLELMTVQD